MGISNCCMKLPEGSTYGDTNAYFDAYELDKAYAFFSNKGLETPYFSLDGVKSWCRVVDVYDGDTLTLVAPYKDKSNAIKISVRLLGIDTCEMKSRLSENRDKSLRARNRVIQLLTGRQEQITVRTYRKDIQQIFKDTLCIVWVEFQGMDKYKRVLAHVYPASCTSANSESISNILLREGLAFEYFGGTKLNEDEQAAI